MGRESSEAAWTRPSGRLFRKYALLFVLLVSGALVTSGGLELWFSYWENRTALVRLQQEKAVGAAAQSVFKR